MKIPEAREKFNGSIKTLNKARRRYVRKIAPFIAADHSLLWVCADRGKARGLWSANTIISDVRFSILRQMCKLDGSMSHWQRWPAWLLRNGWGQAPWFDRKAPELVLYPALRKEVA